MRPGPMMISPMPSLAPWSPRSAGTGLLRCTKSACRESAMAAFTGKSMMNSLRVRRPPIGAHKILPDFEGSGIGKPRCVICAKPSTLVDTGREHALEAVDDHASSECFLSVLLVLKNSESTAEEFSATSRQMTQTANLERMCSRGGPQFRVPRRAFPTSESYQAALSSL
jgi:hypothetical protein